MKRQFSARKKQIILVGFILIATAVFGFYLSGVRNQNIRGNLSQAAIKPMVDSTVVKKQDMIRKISLTGQTVPEAQIDIAAKYSGRITWINASLGQAVSAGEVLIIQDTGDIDLSIDQTDAARRQAAADATETEASFAANYQKVRAEYQRSLVNYERYQSLYRMGAVSHESLDTIEQQMINAKAALDALDNQNVNGVVPAMVDSKQAALSKVERNIAALEKQRDDLILRAPRSGVIGYRQAEVGALVQAGQKLLTIVDHSRVYADCQISEQEIAHIKVGLPVGVQLESLGNTYPGTIIYVSPASDAATQKYIVRIALQQADPLIRSGMFARAKIAVLQRPQTLFVAREAVVEKNGRTYLMIITDDHTVEERKVTLGLRNDEDVEILSGIAEGERVAVSNLARLRPGLAVELNQAEPAAAGHGGE